MFRPTRRRVVAGLLSAAAGAVMASAWTPAAYAQSAGNYPSQVIKFVVSFPGLTENIARLMGEYLTEKTGASVVVEPRPGGGGIIAAQHVAQQPADGYTVFFTTNTTQVGNPAIKKSLTYDPTTDFAPIARIAQGALLFVVPPSLPVDSVAQLRDLAASKPGGLTFGFAGTSGRAAVELFKVETGTDIRAIPYKAAPDAMQDLLGGRIDLMASELSSAVPLVKDGKLKALAVSSAERLDIVPDIPTMREAGIDGFEMTYWVAAYVPDGTPEEIVKMLNENFVAGTKSERISEFLKNAGMVGAPSTPEELAAYEKVELEKWKRIVSAAGMQEQ